MKRTLAVVSFAIAGLFVSAQTSLAVPYTFNFTGANVMSYTSASFGSGATPDSIGMYDGAMRYTFPTDSGSGSWSSWLAGTSGLFNEWAQSTAYRLTMFNMWGFGDYQTANVTAWGEDFLVKSWSDTGTANKNWASSLYSDSGTLGKTVLAFGSAGGYYSALSFNGSNNPLFSFTLDLDPTTTPWLNGVDGQLVFWFGGSMVNSADAYRGLLQGNMVLTGKSGGVAPVPEPTTLLLFGAGLAGLAFVGRRNRSRN